MSTAPSPRDGRASAAGYPGGWRRLWRTAFMVATVLGIFSVAFVYFGMRWSGKPLTVRHAILAGLPDWYFWAALTPMVFWLGQRFRFLRGQWLRAAAVHLVAGAIVALVELTVVAIFMYLFYENPYVPATTFADAYRRTVLQYFHFAFIIYWLIVVAAHAHSFYRQSRQRELETSLLSLRNADLETKLTQAQLEMLRAQLNPHFLFNTLNTVSGLVRDGRSEQATELVATLGQLLRRSLGRIQQNEITLREEVEFVQTYLAIERARFRDRLAIDLDVEPESLELRVPTMVLQPLVENAIRHGLGDGAAGGHIRISARRERGFLRLQVQDDGRGFSPRSRIDGRGSIGIANTRARLERLYGSTALLDLRSGEGGGAVATVLIPQPALATAS